MTYTGLLADTEVFRPDLDHPRFAPGPGHHRLGETSGLSPPVKVLISSLWTRFVPHFHHRPRRFRNVIVGIPDPGMAIPVVPHGGLPAISRMPRKLPVLRSSGKNRFSGDLAPLVDHRPPRNRWGFRATTHRNTKASTGAISSPERFAAKGGQGAPAGHRRSFPQHGCRFCRQKCGKLIDWIRRWIAASIS